MDSRLNEVDRKQIASTLQQICTIADIEAPQDIVALVDYMQRKFKNTLQDIEKAMDFWIANESRIIKPRRLNVKFLSDVMIFYKTHVNARTNVRPKYKEYVPTETEVQSTFKKAYVIAWEEYYYSIKTNDCKVMLKQLETLCDYAVQQGWVDNTKWTDEQIEQELEWLKGYAKRYHDKIHENDTNQFRRMARKFNDVTDYQKAVVMSLHFRDKIRKGDVPSKFKQAI